MTKITFPNNNTFEFSPEEISFLLDYIQQKLELGKVVDAERMSDKHYRALDSLQAKNFLFIQNFYPSENDIIVNPNLLWRVIDLYPQNFRVNGKEERLELCFGITKNGDRPPSRYQSTSVFGTFQYSKFRDMTFSDDQIKVFSRFDQPGERENESHTPNREYFKQFILKPLLALNF